MFGKQSALAPVASLLFLAAAGAMLAGRSVAEAGAANASWHRAEIAEFVVVLSGRCTIQTIRLPDRFVIAQFDGGDCDERAVVRSANQPVLYVGSRDGTVNALSLPDLGLHRSYRLDRPARHMLATSGGAYLIAAIGPEHSPTSLVVLHAGSLAPARIIVLADHRGRALTVAQLVEVRYRQSVLISFADANEMWELFLAPDAEPVFEGMVHDYRFGEAISEPRNLPIRRIATDSPMEHFLVEPGGPYLSQLVEDRNRRIRVRRFNLDVRRTVSERPIVANMDLRSAKGVMAGHAEYWLATDRDDAGIHVFQLAGMKYMGIMDLPGSGCRPLDSVTAGSSFFARCSIDGADMVFTIDRKTLALRAMLQPHPGRPLSQIAFSGTPGYLLAAVAGESGELVVYDSRFPCRIGGLAVPRLRRIVD